MHWNHRIIAPSDPDFDPHFIIGEVYYNEKNEPVGWTEAKVIGETVQDLRVDLTRMMQALDKPVLTSAEFKSVETHR